MKALSVHPYYAMAIVAGQKSIECRSWSTDYRGDILICSTAKKYHGTIPGHALGVVTLEDVRPFTKKDCDDALMEKSDFSPGLFAWILSYNRIIKPIPLKGKLGFWHYDGELEYLPEEEYLLQPGDDPDKVGEWVAKYWDPITV